MGRGIYLRTEQTRRNIALSALGRKWSLKSRKKLVDYLTGRKLSEETKRKISERAKKRVEAGTHNLICMV